MVTLHRGAKPSSSLWLLCFCLLLAWNASSARAQQEVACDSFDGLVDRDVRFKDGCTFHGQVRIAASDVTLDCAGGVIDGRRPDLGGLFTSSKAYEGYGVVVASGDSATDPFPQVDRVTIKNCTVQYFSKGIVLERQVAGRATGGGLHPRIEEPVWLYRERVLGAEEEEAAVASDIQEARKLMYGHAIKNLTIANTTVQYNFTVGIFIHAYSQFSRLDHVTVQHNGDVGIYLERESRYTTIVNSFVRNNGFGYDEQNHRFNCNGWTGCQSNVFVGTPDLTHPEVKPKREGIAIDGSAHNTLTHNVIEANQRAGIALYKNCGEHFDPNNVESADPRWQHADHNRIVHNTIRRHHFRGSGEWNASEPIMGFSNDSGIGVWIAMRQGQQKDDTPGEFRNCLDEAVPDPETGSSHYYDYASFNTVAYNAFESNWLSVLVGDDFNQIVGNTFDVAEHDGRPEALRYDVYVGNPFRGHVGDPVRGTSLVKNTSYTPTRNTSLRRIVVAHGSWSGRDFLGDMLFNRGQADAVGGGPAHCDTVANRQDSGRGWNGCALAKPQVGYLSRFVHGVSWAWDWTLSFVR